MPCWRLNPGNLSVIGSLPSRHCEIGFLPNEAISQVLISGISNKKTNLPNVPEDCFGKNLRNNEKKAIPI